MRIFDKYLGDALYAAMVYVLFRPFFAPTSAALFATATMTLIELFQLSMIPAGMIASESIAVRISARLLGVHFSAFDLLAYAVGIGAVYAADVRWKFCRGSVHLQSSLRQRRF